MAFREGRGFLEITKINTIKYIPGKTAGGCDLSSVIIVAITLQGTFPQLLFLKYNPGGEGKGCLVQVLEFGSGCSGALFVTLGSPGHFCVAEFPGNGQSCSR